jgi:hypothetical protein
MFVAAIAGSSIMAFPASFRVCLLLMKPGNFDHEIQGRLGLVESPFQSTSPSRALFRIGSFKFAASEIEYCVRED